MQQHIKNTEGAKSMFMNLKSKETAIFFLVLWISLTNTLFSQQEENSNRESIEYQIEVEAQVIPFFAVDKRGEPVYNLEEKDIELFINKKSFPIASFSRYKFESDRSLLKDKASQVIKYPERFVFIIIDTIFNSKQGLKRSKMICNKIMRSSSPGDAFVLLENTLVDGLHYIFGPEKDKNKLAKAMKRISKQSEGSNGLTGAMKTIRRARRRIMGYGDASASFRMGDKVEASIMEWEERSAIKELKDNLKRFSRAISSLKYALRTITASKIVYLISEGIATGALRDSKFKGRDTDTIYYFDLLKETAKSINLGGCILNVINPSKIPSMDNDEYSGKQSLKYIAEESGGKYFGGSDIDGIASRIKKSTTAYYELFFMVGSISKEKMRIKIKCRKPGVNIHTIIHSEKQKPYRKMEKLEKKLFAFNVIVGGSWSRMVGKVERIKYKRIQSKGKKFKHITVVIPKNLWDRKVDIFIIHLEPKTMKADFEYFNRGIKEKLPLKIKTGKEKRHFFVIIDPLTTSCVYNLVK